MSYSLWLEAEGRVKDQVSSVIQNLSARFGTPAFNPHVTLLSGIDGDEQDVLNKAQQLASRLTNFTVNLTGNIVCEEVWSRAMIDLVEKTPDLMRVNQLSQKVFGIKHHYMPHLSLMYTKSVPVDMKTRQELVQTLDSSLLIGSFQVDHLGVYTRVVPIEQWDLIGHFSFAVDKTNSFLVDST